MKAVVRYESVYGNPKRLPGPWPTGLAPVGEVALARS
jgi:hypothetical protein